VFLAYSYLSFGAVLLAIETNRPGDPFAILPISVAATFSLRSISQLKSLRTRPASEFDLLSCFQLGPRLPARFVFVVRPGCGTSTMLKICRLDHDYRGPVTRPAAHRIGMVFSRAAAAA